MNYLGTAGYRIYTVRGVYTSITRNCLGTMGYRIYTVRGVYTSITRNYFSAAIQYLLIFIDIKDFSNLSLLNLQDLW